MCFCSNAMAQALLESDHIQLVEELPAPGLETEISGIYPHPDSDDLYLAVSNGKPVYKPTMKPMLPEALRNKLLVVNKQGEIVESYHLPDGGGLFGGMGQDNEGRLWLGPLDPPQLWQFNMASGKVEAEYPLPGPVGGLDFDREQNLVRMTNYIGHPSMLVVDPTSGEIVQSLWSDENCQGIAKVDGDWLTFWTSSWEPDAFSELWQLDGTTGKPKYKLRVDLVHAAMAPLDPDVSGYAGFMALAHLDSGISGRAAIRKYRYISESKRGSGPVAIEPRPSVTSSVAVVSAKSHNENEIAGMAGRLQSVAGILEQASTGGARFVVLPEHFLHGEFDASVLASDLAQTIPGPMTQALGEASRTAGVWLSFSMLEQADSAYYVSNVLLDSHGTVRAKFRKRMLNTGGWDSLAQPGFARVLFDTVPDRGVRIGISSGHDSLTSIPRLASRGANIVLVNASWSPTSRVDWRARIQKLSTQHNVAVVVSDSAGKGSGVYLPSGDRPEPTLAADEISITLFEPPAHAWRVITSLGLPEVPLPSDLPFSPALVELGKRLFFDARLSNVGDVSCESCHNPQIGFADSIDRSTGTKGRQTRRNVPSLLNVAYRGTLNWDGNPTTIEQQIKYPLLGAAEMDIQSVDMLHERLQTLNALEPLQRFYATENVGFEEVSSALAAYLRTLVSAASPFDRFFYGQEPQALGDEEQRGLELFTTQFRCSECHTLQRDYALFADDRFHRIGVGFDNETDSFKDPGVGTVSNYDYEGMFFTPPLRNVAHTGPYMHDGSIADLRKAISAHYAQQSIVKEDVLARPSPTPEELDALTALLESLTGANVNVGSGPAAAQALSANDHRQQHLDRDGS